MDNLSHSVAGLVVSELIARRLPPEPDPIRQRTRHRLLLVAGTVASSFPDLDLFLSGLLPPPLGYLLHHRGHTHTLLYALPQALLLCALIWLLWPAARRLLRVSRVARIGLAGVVAAGFGLHLAMDFLNSYGIHPFHPFDSHWLYGDLVFIIEPVFWVALGVPLAMLVRPVWLRALLLGLLGTVLAWFAWHGYLHWGSLLGLYALGALLACMQWRTKVHRDARALGAGVAAVLAFLAVQAVASRQAALQLHAALAELDPASTVVDTARTAFPANPLCWSFVSVEMDEAADRYRLRRGVLALAPKRLPVAACPAALAQHPGQHGARPDLALQAEYQGSLAELRTLYRENCHFNAWMRFARAPRLEGAVAGDMRFSTSPRGNFTSIDLADFVGAACPQFVPQWGYPRADLLGGKE